MKTYQVLLWQNIIYPARFNVRLPDGLTPDNIADKLLTIADEHDLWEWEEDGSEPESDYDSFDETDAKPDYELANGELVAID